MDRVSPLGEYEARLPAELESSVAARRLLASAVSSWGLGDGARQDGALAVSELVTNAVLHAHTPVCVRIKRLGAGIRIEVEDGDPHMPVVSAARPEDLLSNRSMTGRGLALIAATCDRWGAEPRGCGKITWAEVATGQRVIEAVPAPNYPPMPAAPMIPEAVLARGVFRQTAVAGAGRRVHLVGVPVQLLLESTQQLSDLHREMQVMLLGRDAPPELENVVQAGKPWISDIDLWTDSDRRMAESAAALGRETIDFDVLVPEDIVSKIEGVASWLRRAASSITRRQLLTLPATAEVTAYRRWYGDEILRQLSGREPRPCPVRLRADA
ncbi:MAG TPA: ATP-binding protein [Acidimicrobiales bacterium]|jgi:anti-sigma regulatory factor (Ser/Thr protein kinase)|nr:ATP-binding protein [Acidimicrobiales bacterium]